MNKKILAIITLLCHICLTGFAEQVNPDIKKVHIIFKTHLDIGFTDISSVIEKRYVDNFIPKAIDLAEKLRAEGGEERYVWTTGSWVIGTYLQQAEKSQVERLDKAIKQGDIVWNSLPYTTTTETLTKDHLRSLLRLSEWLDNKYDKKTISGKFTDVPGHTRAIVPVLQEAGIKLLHIGVNKQSYAPEVPEISIWHDEQSNSEVMLMLVGHYGTEVVLPDNQTAVGVFFTGDNIGPHSEKEVKAIYAKLRKKYPNAKLVASTLCNVANELETMKAKLPVITEELADTWIHGMGGSPDRMAKYRALERLYTKWVNEKKMDPISKRTIDYMITLGMIAEHTWGIDVKTHLKNYDIYDFDKFNVERTKNPAFIFAEKSWKEIDDYIGKAIAILPNELQKEAVHAIEDIGKPNSMLITENAISNKINKNGAYTFDAGCVNMVVGELAYQTFSAGHYDRYYTGYLDQDDWTNLLAVNDFIKPGLEFSKAQDVTITASMQNCKVDGDHIYAKLKFPEHKFIDSNVLPKDIFTKYTVSQDGKTIDVDLTMIGKPANRLPEVYWYTFLTDNLVKVIMEKTGEKVDVMDIVRGGNRQMHGIDNYVDLVTTSGTIRINSKDAFIMSVGERTAMNFTTEQPDISKGIHFALVNNLWGTNFTMWWGGSMTYRFKIELLPRKVDPKKDKVVMLVKEDTYKELESEIKTYKENVEKRFPVNIDVVKGNWEKPVEVRQTIKDLCYGDGLNGVILIGNIPMHRFYMHDYANPNPLYYEDPMLKFNDDIVATQYFGTPNPQIWVANMRSNTQPNKEDIEGLKKFFNKTHSYYRGEQKINNDMLVVFGSEWGDGGRMVEKEVRGKFNKIDTLIGISGNKATYLTRRKLLDAFKQNYKMFVIQVHSNEYRQDLEGGGSIFAEKDIYPLTTGSLFTINMGCSNGNFFKAAEAKNTAQSWVFGKGIGQAVLSQVRVGMVYGYDKIFDRLKAGEYIGKAYLSVKREGEAEMRHHFNGNTVSGVILLGNPFINIYSERQ